MRRWKTWVERELPHVESSDGERRQRACAALGKLRVRGAAAPAQRQLDRVFARLSGALRRGAAPAVRRDAAYALSSWAQSRAFGALLESFGDAAEDPLVRAQAAEGVGLHLQHAVRSDLRARAVELLRAGLKDAAPAVRFWSAYALAMAKAEEARGELEALAGAGDRGIWQNGWWTVSEEAQDALDVLDGQPWPDRIPAPTAEDQESGF